MQRAVAADLSERVDLCSQSEGVVAIGEAYNEMMDEIQLKVVRVRRFGADVSASAEEQTALITEVAQQIGTLWEHATELAGLLDSFETGRRTAADDGAATVQADGGSPSN